MRHNFSSDTRHVIGARAGFRCSYPGCGRLTVGPAMSVDTFENTGFACHIYAASPDGPRGQGALSPEQLAHATNGIWMCGAHENLIDKKSGIRHPVHTLQSWKALHEFRTSYEHSGNQAAFGFAWRLTLHHSPLFAPSTTIELAKTTFLIGLNGSGKTALCEWLTALGTSRFLGRWIKPHGLAYEIMFDAPAAHRLQVKVADETVAFELDDQSVSRNYARSTVVFLKGRGDKSIKCRLLRLQKLFGIEELELRNLVSRVRDSYVSALRFEPWQDDDDGEDASAASSDRSFDLICSLSGQDEPFSFGQLSGGEQGRVLLAIAMTLAKEAVQFGPVILMIEIKNLGMDWGSTEPYLREFASSSCLYQTIVTSWELPRDIAMLGWQIYELSRLTSELGVVTPVLL